MNKCYSRINWENYPSTATAVNATNLNKIDFSVNELDNRVINLDTTKLSLATAYTMVKSISYNESTGVFTVTYLNGTTSTLDTKLEKLAINFEYDSANERLVITLSDGTKQYVDMKSLITQYDFVDSDRIDFTVGSDGKVSADIKDGSITGNKLQPNYLADCVLAKDQAETAATTSVNAKNRSEQILSEVDGKLPELKTHTAELQVLGYTVPSECPIQNEFSNGILTQKVERVDLRSLTWRYSSGKNCFMHEKVIPAQTRNLYCTKYTEVTTSRDLNNMEMSTTGWAGANELNIRDDSFNGDASAFKSANGGVYLYYELPTYKTYSVTNDKGINSDDIEFLGWSVPRESPIQNYKDKDGNFHQRVGRILANTINWVRVDANLFNASFNMKKGASTPLYISTYPYVANRGYSVADKNISDWNTSDEPYAHLIIIKDTSFDSASAFLQNLEGKYLYYELDTERVYKQGNECNNSVVSDEWVSTKAYTVGQYAIYLNVLYKCIANNTNIVPTNATYWKRVTITGELMEIWSRLP